MPRAPKLHVIQGYRLLKIAQQRLWTLIHHKYNRKQSPTHFILHNVFIYCKVKYLLPEYNNKYQSHIYTHELLTHLIPLKTFDIKLFSKCCQNLNVCMKCSFQILVSVATWTCEYTINLRKKVWTACYFNRYCWNVKQSWVLQKPSTAPIINGIQKINNYLL